MVTLTIDNIITVTFDDDEWNFIKEHIIENALNFHSATYYEFGELAMDLTNPQFDPQKDISAIKKYKQTIEKLKMLNIKTYDLEKI